MFMTLRHRTIWPLALAALVLSGTAVPAADKICRIEVEGNRRLTRDAFLFELRIKEGDPFDPVALRREFRRLYQRGLFQNIKVEARTRPECLDLRFTVAERPTIIAIDYDEVKALTRQNIEDYYRERKIELRVGGPVHRKILFRAEKAIADLLGQKGFLGAEVHAREETVSPGSRKIHFSIRTGPKTKIRKIEFAGNEVFSDRKLKKTLKITRQWRWWWPFGAKTLYHPLKYQQDIQNSYDLYRKSGYLDVDIKPPVVEVREADPEVSEKAEEKAARKYRKKLEKYETKRNKAEEKGQPPPDPPRRTAASLPRRWVYLSIRVDEGQPYDLGELRVEGNHVLETDRVLSILNRAGMKEGNRLNEASLKVALEVIRGEYGRRGYIYADVGRRILKRAEGKIADVVVTVDEDRQYYVDRIEFEGHTLTQDTVLRREMRLAEGDLMNRLKLNLSVLKLRQLGFWQPTEDPIIEPLPGEDRVRIRIRGQEESRNEVQVGGGYSELEGAFFAGSFRTSNFLGRGESLGVGIQIGGRSKRYDLSFMEPWFLGRPYSLGLNLFRREIDYGRSVNAQGDSQRLRRLGSGGRIILGRQLGALSSIRLTYSYERIEADTADISSLATTKTTIASLTPMFIYNDTNHPWRPNRGRRLLAGVEVASASLGGENDFIKPSMDLAWYLPLFGRTFLGVHGRAAFIRAFGSADELDPTLVNGVPRFERFFSGGDQIGPRVYETRSLSPIRYRVQLDGWGRLIRDPDDPLPTIPVFVGGSKQLLLQFEYTIPLGRPADFVVFFDAGNAFDNGEDFSLGGLRLSTGLETRLYLPVFQAPIRLIYGWPINEEPGDQTSRFQFTIGTSF